MQLQKQLGRSVLLMALLAALPVSSAHAGLRCYDLSKNLILAVQEVLLDQGFEPGPVDGILGPKTTQAVAAYQQSKGLDVTYDLNGSTLRLIFGPAFRPEAYSLEPNPDLPPDLFEEECR